MLFLRTCRLLVCGREGMPSSQHVRLGVPRWYEHLDLGNKCVEAASLGDLSFFETNWDKIEQHVHYDVATSSRYAALNGHLNIIAFLMQKGARLWPSLLELAGSKGHLHIMKYAYERGHMWCPYAYEDGTRVNITEGGYLDCLVYAHEHGCPWNKHMCEAAAENGRLACLRYAHENGCPWDAATCTVAAQNGRLDCLMYAHENGCPWNAFTCATAALRGHLNCLMYAHENGCPWDEVTITNAIMVGEIDCLKYAHEHGLRFTTVSLNRLTSKSAECFKYAIMNGCPTEPDVMERIAGVSAPAGLEMMRFAYENGCPWHIDTCIIAARVDNVDCLRFAHQNGCPILWKQVQREAIQNFKGNVECLEYILENAPPSEDITWDDEAFMNWALKIKYARTLKFLHERAHVPIPPDACRRAGLSFRFEVLKYAHEHGCPLERWPYTISPYITCFNFELDRGKCFKYALDNGVQWDFKRFPVPVSRSSSNHYLRAILRRKRSIGYSSITEVVQLHQEHHDVAQIKLVVTRVLIEEHVATFIIQRAYRRWMARKRALLLLGLVLAHYPSPLTPSVSHTLFRLVAPCL